MNILPTLYKSRVVNGTEESVDHTFTLSLSQENIRIGRGESFNDIPPPL